MRLTLEVKFYLQSFKLINKNFTIISNNCWGGILYKRLNIQYKTPFVGLFLFPKCYLELLENFEKYIFLDLDFIDPRLSKYTREMTCRGTFNTYPIGLFQGTDIEVHFLHYKNINEAREKWYRRRMRINLGNMLVKFSDKDLVEEDIQNIINRFHVLPFKHKICFTRKPGFKCCIYYPELSNKKESERWRYIKYVNIISHLNNLTSYAKQGVAQK